MFRGKKTAALLAAAAMPLFFVAPVMAQRRVAIDFGAKLGVGLDQTLQENFTGPLASSTDVSFAHSPVVGPSVGVLLFDRIDVRFEALYREVSYRRRSLAPGAAPATTTNGHSWEFPLLGNYRFNSLAVKPFVGGGATLGSTVNTTGVRRPDASAWIVNAGFQHQIGHQSLRVEFRHTHWYYSGTAPQSITRTPQVDILFGFSLGTSRRSLSSPSKFRLVE
jgi:hypothetical protein